MHKSKLKTKKCQQLIQLQFQAEYLLHKIVIPAGFAKPLGMRARLATSSAIDQGNIHFIQPVHVPAVA